MLGEAPLLHSNLSLINENITMAEVQYFTATKTQMTDNKVFFYLINFPGTLDTDRHNDFGNSYIFYTIHHKPLNIIICSFSKQETAQSGWCDNIAAGTELRLVEQSINNVLYTCIQGVLSMTGSKSFFWKLRSQFGSDCLNA